MPPAVKFLIDFASAVLGMLGTWQMSRRYAPQFVRTMVFALAWPFLCLLGRKRRRVARAFFEARASINWDLPESAGDMALGLNLLCLAFILQLLALLAEQFLKKQ